MHIALVDSSRVCLIMLKQMLEEGNHTVETFTDGLEARDYITSTPEVNVLLTGLETKSLSGLELCWDVRAKANQRNPIYVIAMSSTPETDKLIKALDSGADDFINKPPVREELYARLRAAERLASMHRELAELALTDPLTGVMNRRSFMEEAEIALEAAKTGTPMSIAILDIDHFKNVNDTYGHDVGDIAIREVANISNIEEGIFGRLGGEEFGLVLSGKTAGEAADVAEKLRHDISKIAIPVDKKTVSFTCSIGICEWCPGDSVHDLMKRADLALYDAKRSGRDQVVIMRTERKSSAA